MLWPAWRLVVELDGRRFHDNPWAFERDRRRDAILRTAGYEILRVSHRRLMRDPDAVIADIRALAALTAARPRSAAGPLGLEPTPSAVAANA